MRTIVWTLRGTASLSLALALASCSPAADPRVAAPPASASTSASAAPTPSVVVEPPPEAHDGKLELQWKKLGGVYLGRDKPAVTFVGSSQFVISAGGLSELCDVATWQSVLTLPPNLSNWAVSADGKWLAANTDEDTVLLEAATGKEKAHLAKRADGREDPIALSPSGDKLLVMQQLEVQTYKLRASVWDTLGTAGSATSSFEREQILPLGSGVFNAEGKPILWLEGRQGPDVFEGESPRRNLWLMPPLEVAFAPDGAAIVSGAIGEPDPLDLQIFDFPGTVERLKIHPTGSVRPRAKSEPPHVRSLSASNGAARVAMNISTGGDPLLIVVYDGRTGKPIAQHDEWMESPAERTEVYLSPDGKTLLVARLGDPVTEASPGLPVGSRPYQIYRGALP